MKECYFYSKQQDIKREKDIQRIKGRRNSTHKRGIGGTPTFVTGTH